MIKRDDLKAFVKLRILNPNWSRTKCATAAGFPGTKAVYLERCKEYASVAEEVAAEARDIGLTPKAVLETLKRSMDRSKEQVTGKCDATANQAAKIAGEFLGMQSPLQIKAEVTTKQSVLIGILDKIRND